MREAGVEEDQSSDEEDESDTDNPLKQITFIDTSLTVFAIDDSFEVRFLKSSIQIIIDFLCNITFESNFKTLTLSEGDHSSVSLNLLLIINFELT